MTSSDDKDEKNLAHVEAEHREHQEQQHGGHPRILTIDEEAVDNAVHINLGWRSWVRTALRSYIHGNEKEKNG